MNLQKQLRLRKLLGQSLISFSYLKTTPIEFKMQNNYKNPSFGTVI